MFQLKKKKKKKVRSSCSSRERREHANIGCWQVKRSELSFRLFSWVCIDAGVMNEAGLLFLHHPSILKGVDTMDRGHATAVVASV